MATNEKNGPKNTLTAVDFLGLAEKKRVARIDLSKVGYEGVVYVCDLSTAKQQSILARPKSGKMKINRDQSYEINLADLPPDAAPKFLAECLVTSSNFDLEAAFTAVDEDEGAFSDFIVVPANKLAFMYDDMLSQLGTKRAVMDKLKETPNIVTNEVVRTVRLISGMSEGGGDAVDEKKDN